MNLNEGSLIRALTVYQASEDDDFDIDPRDDTSDKGPRPIKELVKLQLRPKPRKCMQLTKDLSIMSINTSSTCYTKVRICLLGIHLTC